LVKQVQKLRPSPGRFCICIPYEESTEKNCLAKREGLQRTSPIPSRIGQSSWLPCHRCISLLAVCRIRRASSPPHVDLGQGSSPSARRPHPSQLAVGGRGEGRGERERRSPPAEEREQRSQPDSLVAACPDLPQQLACHRGPPPSRPQLACAQVACHLGRTSALMLCRAVAAPALAPDFLSAVAVGDRGRRRICWRWPRRRARVRLQAAGGRRRRRRRRRPPSRAWPDRRLLCPAACSPARAAAHPCFPSHGGVSLSPSRARSARKMCAAAGLSIL
jgi:hypothetical protein